MANDTRETIPVQGSFYNQILELFEQQQQAGILYEDGGVTRANGLITALFEKDGKQWMRLNDELDVPIDKLYAVNGIFSSDFSTC